MTFRKLSVPFAASRCVILVYALIFILLCVDLAWCTHFRGAAISWRPVNASNTDTRVVISFQIAWRKSYDSSTYCDDATINSGRLIGPGGDLQCRSAGCSGNIGSMNFKCTDYSVKEDWSAGRRNYTYTFPDHHPPLYQASFTGGDWINLVTGSDRDWEVRMYVNLTRRKDTGLINTSPTTAMSPIVRLQYGCNHTLVIPVSDADKDDIRCRWAEYSKGECAGVCKTFPGAVLDERKCQIHYLATRSTGWYAVAIMVEDFTDRLSSNALSGIPIQFLVQVFTSRAKCTSKPEFSGETKGSGFCIGIPPGSTFNERIIAKSQGSRNRIVEIKTISPSGLTKSSLAQYSGNEWYVNVTWTPSSSQVDPVIFCYTAIDANGLSSDQSCVTLLAGVAPPYMVNGSQSPTGLIYPTNQRWTVNFDKEFVRPTRSRYIRIFRSDGTEVYSVDVSISHNVIYPAGSLGRTLEFRPSFEFIEQTVYYMVFDPGVVQGTKFCALESPPIRDPYFWRFKIRDVTPPVVTFISAPTVTSNATTITWRIDEPATSLCTVTGPTQTSVFACNTSWAGSGLAEGYYRISITATDAAGNIARPVFHSWNVDLTPPEPYLTTKPRAFSNQTSSTFQFNCRRDSTCYYECSVTQDGASPTYSSCYGSGFVARNLVNDVVYVFRLKARDGVGNQAQVLTYKWRVGNPLEPPVLEASSSGGIEDTSIPVFLSARIVGINRTNDLTLSITIYGVPDSFVFSRGMRSKDQVRLLKEQFGDLFVTPPKDFSGNVTVDIVAQAVRGPEQVQTKSSFTISVRAKADVPTLITEDACVNLTGLIPLSIKARLSDIDGSEKLTIALSGLPNEYELNHQGELVNGTHYLDMDSLTGLIAQYEGTFEPFVLKVVATSVEKSNGDSASVMKVINATSCILQYSTVHTNPRGSKKLAAIAGVSIGGGLIFLFLFMVLVLRVRKNKARVHNAQIQERLYNNPTYERFGN